MTRIVPGRHRAIDHDGYVLFLIGMRINRFSAVRRWMKTAAAMGRMLPELAKQPELGLLHARSWVSLPREVMTVQYWRDFDALEAYARNPAAAHLPAWQEFNRLARQANDGAVGIWHETYRIAPGSAEQIYVDMPLFGAGAALGTQPVGKGSNAARERMG